MPRRPPPPLGLTLTILRTAQGWSQKELAEVTGLSRAVLSEYETGKTTLTRQRLDELAAAMGCSPESVDVALPVFDLLRRSSVLPNSPVDPDVDELRIINRASAVAARETAEALRAELSHEVREAKTVRARETADALWRRLKSFSSAERRVLVAGAREFQDSFLCMRLCGESERAAASDPGLARELAELALFVAERVPGQPAWQSRLRGYAWAFVGNARRVANDHLAADEAFSKARSLWIEGLGSSPGLLEEARVFDLEASLRKDQRRFTEALKLHDQALAVANQDGLGSLLLNKASTLEQSGDFEGSLDTLERAARSLKGQQPRLLCVLRFNEAVALLHLGRLSEAEPLVAETRELVLRLGNELDLVRVLWLEGRLSARRGQIAEAVGAFEQVRREFSARAMAYDFALVSLDLAALYREQGCVTEVKALAQQMVWLFRAQAVHREAFAALRLFQEAVEKEELTAEFVCRLGEYLNRARSDPMLKFEGESRSHR